MANKLITLRGTDTANNTALVNFTIEMWDIEDPADIFLGEGITDTNGETIIEVTETTFNKVFIDSSPSIYYKVFSGGTLVSNSRNPD